MVGSHWGTLLTSIQETTDTLLYSHTPEGTGTHEHCNKKPQVSLILCGVTVEFDELPQR